MRGAVAVIEDDAVVRRNLNNGLTACDYQVVWTAHNGASALQAVEQSCSQVGVLVLDLGLPDVDGLDLLGALRSRGLDVPALALTARSSLDDRLTGFSVGFDDYLIKPFAFEELLARLDALIRRRATPEVGSGVTLDPIRHELRRGVATAALTPLEYRLFSTLLSRRLEVVRRRTLIAAAWPPGALVRDNTLDAYVTRLRKHLGVVSPETVLKTVRGVGYRLA